MQTHPGHVASSGQINMPARTSAKELALLKSTLAYFAKDPDAWGVMASIVSRPVGAKSIPAAPSLRVVFFYVSQFTRDAAAAAAAATAAPGGERDRGGASHRSISEGYQQMLRIHTKHRFDPFCRRSRREVALHGLQVSTNVGQLVFFRWFIREGVFAALCHDHERVVETRSRVERERRETRRRKKAEREEGARQSVSVADGGGPQGEEVPGTRVVVTFDQPPTTDIRIAVRFWD